MNINEIPDEVLDALRNRGHSDAEISKMPPQKMFNEFCMWEGLIGYGPRLWRIVEDLKEPKQQAGE